MSTYVNSDGIRLTSKKDILIEHEHHGAIRFAKILHLFTNTLTFSMMMAASVGNSWQNSDDVTMGLWKVCFRNTCVSYTEELMGSEERFLRITAVLSCMSAFSSVCLTIYGLCSSQSRGVFASIFSMFASVCMLSTLILYINEDTHNAVLNRILLDPNENMNLSYGSMYFLGWISSGISIVNSIAFPFIFYNIIN